MSADMVDVRWEDGTTRTVEVDTPLLMEDGVIVYAARGGFRHRPGGVRSLWKEYPKARAAGTLTRDEVDPPVKINVPSGVGAVLEAGEYPQGGATVFPVIQFVPGYWVDMNGMNHTDTDVRRLITGGAVIVHEGMRRAGA